MCWTGINYPKIAIIDIKVFKIVVKTSHTNSYRSFYHTKSIWKIKERKESKIGIEFNHNCFTSNSIKINEGLHSYNHSCNLDIRSNYLLIMSIDKDIKLDTICSDKNLYVMDCVIPKGSMYYVNRHGEYVSDALIPIKAISINNYIINKQ